MQTPVRLIGFLSFFLIPLFTFCQPRFYQYDTSVKVYAYGRQQTLAWSGGFNNPQFGMADLNYDGIADLVVFTPWIGVQTFINRGTGGVPDYRYAPEYALNFPALYDYMVLADYNCDGIPDLFDQGSTGFEVYKGYYNSFHQLCFTFYRQLFYDNDQYSGGSTNAFNNPGDIPAIVDVDGDGDLDFIAYDISGGWMNLYKNMRVEKGLPCDSIYIELKDRCWGRVYQGFYRTHYLARTCDETHLGPKMPGGSGKRTHSGNTPCLFDWDMDGDYDYLDGSVSFNEMTFLKNGRIPNNSTGPDTMVYQDTLWQTSGKQIEIPFFPAAFNVDIDMDGKKDLLIAPNGVGINAENYKCIWFYKNYTTPGSPDWRFESDSFLTDMTIDLGTAAYPVLFDYNKDGKPDLFIGSDGYFNNGQPLLGKVSLYLNTGTASSPAFTLQTRDFMGISAGNFSGTAPAFGDIDGDGKTDMIIGHANGTLSYYKNIAAYDTVQPNWQLMQTMLTDMNGDTINVDGHAAPFIYDVDKDGKKDLIIGDIYGHIRYYQNVSATPGTISLKLINTQLGGVAVDGTRFYGNDAVPFIGKIDSTGIEYLLVGSNSGNVYQYTGFQSGDTTATYTLVNAHYAYIDSTHSLYNHPGTLSSIYDNLRSSVTVGDIAGDGSYYMLVGDVRGGVVMYKYKVYTPPIDRSGIGTVNEDGRVSVYPNPAKDVLNVSWNGIQQPELQISFINMAGQTLYSTVTSASAGHASLPAGMLPSGMYVCVVQSGVNRYYSKFTIIR